VFAELPTVWTLAGAAVIVLSTLYIARREAQLAKPAS
jgi:drug/metabolite transporter (DMT)-like permease